MQVKVHLDPQNQKDLLQSTYLRF